MNHAIPPFDPGPDHPSASVPDYLEAIPQYLYPQRLLTMIMRGAARIRSPRIKNRQIRWFIRRYQVPMDEALEPDPSAYAHFNDFFTRALAPGARPLAGDEHIISPVDGHVSAFGSIDSAIPGGGILQAKGRAYTVTDLLSKGVHDDAEAFAAPFLDGQFITLYLSPRDYHRVHMPVAGHLREMRYLPGRLFSVNTATTRAIPRLFARNERLVMRFDTPSGPLALVMVGAILVGGIETVWAGAITPSYGQPVSIWRYHRLPEEKRPQLAFDQGQEIARFNTGSTVILLFPRDGVRWDPALRVGAPVRMGMSMGKSGG
uniref:Phosphatidylserine decarboxylase proenzyme n=1 Tax=Candidatus Kentrum sp. FW TaxID=2126338 RepID=A0A450T0V2_9GAMM|nr:MAG: phosphatidylserine decarboxylase [Candidatus Kentron sp. FW]VFJ60134.1 MAG: phosphatidylserine decarboxylase [Candidatus Kentron sp. FW]